MLCNQENLRLIRHQGHSSGHWSLLQQIANSGSHKRAIWVPIRTQLSLDQAQAYLIEQEKLISICRNS